jgi:hypothetical protein
MESDHPEPLHMHAHAAIMAPAPPRADALAIPDPMRAYRAYLTAVARREFATVIAGMTEACARQLLDLRDMPDFGPLFDLWCDSQHEPVIVTRCAIERDVATIDVRSRRTVGRVTLQLVDSAWRIDSEFHQPLRASAAR